MQYSKALYKSSRLGTSHTESTFSFDILPKPT